ncbi:MAG: ribonuclease J [Clostridia bacterium]|nr:ribonuclease J [Clostridia bacterium]
MTESNLQKAKRQKAEKVAEEKTQNPKQPNRHPSRRKQSQKHNSRVQFFADKNSLESRKNEALAELAEAQGKPVQVDLANLSVRQGNQNKKQGHHRANAVRVVFLGGVGEIGKNITALEYGNDIIIIDSGLSFPGEDMPGVDLVIPDFTYLKENANKIRGIVITHGHEDHIGSLPYLLKEIKAPVFGSKLTLTLLDNKLREHKISGVKGTVVKPRSIVKLGVFTIEFIKVNHSIPGAFALSISSPAGLIFHSGDFKVDFEPIDGEMIDLTRMAEIGSQGVTLLLCESTNVERPGHSLSERQVGQNLEKVFIDNADRRLFVATFSSNIYRVSQIIDLAIKYNRKVAVIGRSMINNIDAGLKIGAFKFDKNVFIDIDRVANMEDKNVLVLSTGSQGEPHSALTRLANGEFNKVEIGKNDTVIFSSNPIPGNEGMINNIINKLYQKGAVVVDENVHASGHACQEELKLLHSLIKPQFFIPVHGEYRHLKEHADLAERLGMNRQHIFIPEIGNVVELTKTTLVQAQNVQAGQQLVDGLGIGDVGSVVLKDRKALSEDGLVIVVIGVSASTGELLSDPYMITRGFVYSGEAEDLVNEAKGVLMDTLALTDFTEDKDWNELRNIIRKPLRNFFYKKTMRSPMILPIIFKV